MIVGGVSHGDHKISRKELTAKKPANRAIFSDSCFYPPDSGVSGHDFSQADRAHFLTVVKWGFISYNSYSQGFGFGSHSVLGISILCFCRQEANRVGLHVCECVRKT